jgi:hypothetical protein
MIRTDTTPTITTMTAAIAAHAHNGIGDELLVELKAIVGGVAPPCTITLPVDGEDVYPDTPPTVKTYVAFDS